MKTRPRARRLLLALALLAVAAGAAAVVLAEDLVRLSRDVPGEARPIDVDADEVVTWTDGDLRVLLLRGQVLVRQGDVEARFQNGAVIVNLKTYRATQVWDADVYGEGGAVVRNGPEASGGATAFVDLHTRGELNLKSHKSKVRQEAQPDDPVYRRAVARRAAVRSPAPAAAPDNPIKPASYTEPATPAQNALPPPAPPPTSPPAAPLLPPVPAPPGPGAPAVPPPAAGGAARGLLGAPLAPGAAPPLRQFSVVPKNPSGFHIDRQPVDRGPGQPRELATIVTGGFILNVRSVDPKTGAADLIDVEADRGVIWTRGDTEGAEGRLNTADGVTGRDIEFYLAGNVEIRSRLGKEERTVRADELYYDVNRNVAVALTAAVEFRQPGLTDPVYFTADEMQQLSPTQFRAIRGSFFSSKLPSDPGLRVVFAEATLEEKKRFRRSIFGQTIQSRLTGLPETETQKLIHADDVILRADDVPVFYLPFLQGDANDPLGPVQNISMGYNSIFGFQLGVTWDVYDLLGIDRVANTRWRLDTDYLSSRGPALGTNFDFSGKDLFGVPSKYTGYVKEWFIDDHGTDDLGGGRSGQPHPEFRDRSEFWGAVNDLPYGFSAQAHVSYLSDQNMLEQYYKREFDEDPNKETFLYVKQQPEHANYAASLLVQDRILDWFTDTNWLPRADGYLIGQSFLDLFTYNVHGDVGYAQFRPANLAPFPVSRTDQVGLSTGRFDVMQELYMPFYAGPVKVMPYAKLDLTDYTQDLNGGNTGRVWGGGGVMASIPFTRLYPDVNSLLWNLKGIDHKIVVTGNFFDAASNERYTNFPQLDRLNDNVNDFSRNDITPLQTIYNPAHGVALATSPVYDPQLYAIRQLIDNRIDTLDQIDELQLDVRQRWQTKRGFPGQEHIVDWMTLDLSGSVFPQPNRDNFGSTFGFLQYDWTWNVGDRTALVSSGWVDPETDGPRVFTFGAYLNRPDRTSLFLGYRQIDPLDSRAVTAAITYVFSPKYAITASTMYDFGTNQAQSNSLVLTRTGSDLQVSFGLTYNALLNSVGVTFEIVPNLLPPSRTVPGFGPGMVGR